VGLPGRVPAQVTGPAFCGTLPRFPLNSTMPAPLERCAQLLAELYSLPDVPGVREAATDCCEKIATTLPECERQAFYSRVSLFRRRQ